MFRSYSPNGQKIAFSTTRDGNLEIYSMNADGTDQTRLTNNPALRHLPGLLARTATRSPSTRTATATTRST